MPVLSLTTHSEHLFHRLRRVLSSLHLHRDCREALDGVLDRFSDLEHKRELRSALADARARRDWIAAQLGFLSDLDDITEHETDDSVFEEMAVLFEEISASATGAAKAIRVAASDAGSSA